MVFNEIPQPDDSYWFIKSVEERYKHGPHRHNGRPKRKSQPQSRDAQVDDRSETHYLHGGLLIVSMI